MAWWNNQKRWTITQALEAHIRGETLPENIAMYFDRSPDRRHKPDEYRPTENLYTRRQGHYFFGGRWIPIKDLKHTFLLGTTGSGKSKTLMMMIKSLAEEVQHDPDMRMFVVASKEDVSESLHSMRVGYTLLDPSNVNTPYWDISSDYTRSDQYRDLANTLLPQDEKTDSFWVQASQMILTGVMTTLQRVSPYRWTLADAVYGSLMSIKELDHLLSLSPGNKQILTVLFRDPEIATETRSNMRIDLMARFYRLFPVASHAQNSEVRFSLRRFLSPGIPAQERIVVLQPDLEARRSNLPLVHSMIRRLTDILSAMNDSETRKVVVTLDEAQVLGKISSINDFTAFTRSKGGRLVFTTQTIDGLNEEYGEKEASSIVGNLPYKAFFAQGTYASAKWCSEFASQIPVWNTKSNYSTNPKGERSRSDSSAAWEARQRLDPYELMYNLPLASPENGLHGYYVIPTSKGLHLYQYHTPPTLVDALVPVREALPRKHLEGYKDLYLRDWNEKEIERFMLASEPNAVAQFRRELISAVFEEINKII